MALGLKGTTLGCPCCGLNLPFTFAEEILCEVESPPSNSSVGTIYVRNRTNRVRVCIRCRYVLEFEPDHPNNLHAKDFARLLLGGGARVYETASNSEEDALYTEPTATNSQDMPSDADPRQMHYRTLVATAKALGIVNPNKTPKEDLYVLIDEARAKIGLPA